MLAHTTSSIVQTDVTDRIPYVGYMYITNDVEPNPYDTIPPYFLNEVAYLDTGLPTPSHTPSTSPGSPTGLAATSISTSQINLSWTAPSETVTGYEIERSTDGDSTWSAIVSNTATTSTTYSHPGLASATQYTYRVSAINTVGTSSPSNTNSATTSSTSTTPPPSPTSVSLAVNSVDLSGSSFTGQWVQLNDSSGNTIATGFTPATFSVTSGSQYTVFAANFQNTVFNHWSDGNTNPSRAITPTQSTTLIAYYSTSSTTAPPPLPTPPGSPTGLAATAISTSQIDLSWTAPSGTISGYMIERAVGSGAFSTIVSNTATTSTTYSDSGAASATQYTYRVSAINSVGTSTPSSNSSATTLVPSSSPPPTSGVAALSGVSGFKSSLYINPGPNGINWQPLIAAKQAHPRVPIIAMINPNSGPGTSYDSNFNTGINNMRASGIIVLGYIGTKYCAMSIATAEGQIDTYHSFYKLDGFLFDEMKNTPGWESYYSTLTNYAKSTYGDTLIIGNPGTSTIQSYVGTVDNIIIYESQGLPSISTLQSRTFGLQKSGFCFDAYGIGNLDPNYVAQASQYLGCMQITDDSGSNPYDTLPTYLSSEIAALDTAGGNPPVVSVPSAPTGLVASVTSASQINLSWTAPSGTISGYMIERAVGSGAFSTIVSNTATTSTTYSDTGTASATQYTYRVSAINSVGTSTPSNTASATTLTSTLPPTTPPTTLSLAVNSVDLSGSSFTGQWVQLNDSSGKTIATGFTPATFSVTSGTQYTVFAANFQNTVFNHWSDGNTNPSRAITPTQSTTLTAYYSTSSTTTPPPSPTSPSSPTGLTATTVSSSQINLSWTAPSGTISGYKIERSTSGGSFSTIVSNTATTATTYSDTGL